MGLEKGEYSLFKVLNRDVIKPAVKEINTRTNFFIEVERKRIGRRIGELKFKISRLKDQPSLEPTQMPLFADMGDLPTIAIKLIQAGVSRKEALRIANQEWNVVEAAALPEEKENFAVYVEEKIELARHATNVRNAGGFIVKAIQENYQDPEIQKQVQSEKAQERKALLGSLKDEMLEKQNTLIRQAVRANPELLEQACAKIHSHIIRGRLEDYDSVQEAYGEGGMVTAEINAILAEEFCVDLLAPLYEVYETEKARILDM